MLDRAQWIRSIVISLHLMALAGPFNLAASRLAGQELNPEDKMPTPGVESLQVMRLRPQSKAEVPIPDFQAVRFSDGSVRLSGRGIERAGGPKRAIEFEVDLATGTYAAREVDPSKIAESHDSAEVLQDERPGSEAKMDEQKSTLEAPSKAIVPGQLWGRLRVQTVDPIFLVLAESSSKLEWTTSTTGKVRWDRRTDTCSAANPSALGTHWFKKSCQPGGMVYNSTSTQVCHDHHGSYYNYDFGLNSLRTDASHGTRICGRNDGYFGYSWSYTDSGEWSILIYGRLILN